MTLMRCAAASYAALSALALCLVLAAGVAIRAFEGYAWTMRCPACRYPMAKVWATSRWHCQKCGWEGE